MLLLITAGQVLHSMQHSLQNNFKAGLDRTFSSLLACVLRLIVEYSPQRQYTCTGCNAVIYVSGSSRISIGQNYSVTCNTFQLESSCVENEFYIFNGSRLISGNKHTLLSGIDSVSSFLNTFYSCVVTLNGSNFTSNPARIPNLIERE